jgi:hypothetical protein
VFGHREVPMLQVFRSFDGSEILIIAAASILVASITFLLWAKSSRQRVIHDTRSGVLQTVVGL